MHSNYDCVFGTSSEKYLDNTNEVCSLKDMARGTHIEVPFRIWVRSNSEVSYVAYSWGCDLHAHFARSLLSDLYISGVLP